jgi:hypothetical protein
MTKTRAMVLAALIGAAFIVGAVAYKAYRQVHTPLRMYLVHPGG